MKQAYILNMAAQTLLNKIDKENKALLDNPNSIISKARLNRYESEYKELTEMIIRAEKEQA